MATLILEPFSLRRSGNRRRRQPGRCREHARRAVGRLGPREQQLVASASDPRVPARSTGADSRNRHRRRSRTRSIHASHPDLRSLVRKFDPGHDRGSVRQKLSIDSQCVYLIPSLLFFVAHSASKPAQQKSPLQIDEANLLAARGSTPKPARSATACRTRRPPPSRKGCFHSRLSCSSTW